MKIKLPKYYPRYCVWEITLACNMRCLHCGSAATGVKREEELSTEQALQLADQLGELGTERLTLSGGELFLRNDWHLIAERLKKHGVQVSLITNGYLIKENIDKIQKLLPLDAVGISLDGIEKTHNYIRHIPDSFQKAVENFKLLKKMGAKTSAITSVSKININELEQIHEILKELKIDAWQLQMVFLGGRMRERPEDCPTPEDMKKVAEFIAKARKTSPILVYPADCIGYYTGLEKQIRHSPWQGCYAGLLVVGIEANGNIKGCLSLAPEIQKDNPFVEGNIKEKSLKEIWNKRDGYAYNRKFSLRKVKGLCRKCQYLKYCRCGCTSTAYFFSGTTYKNNYCIYQLDILAKGKEQPTSIFKYPSFAPKNIFRV